MWTYKYDEFVRRTCKERNLVYPSKLSQAHRNMFGNSIPSNAGILQHTLDRNNKNNLMASHQSFLSDHVHIISDKGIKEATGYGEFDSDYSDSASVTDYDFNSDEYQDMDDLNDMEDVFDHMRAGNTLFEMRNPPVFLPDSDDDEIKEEEKTPVPPAHGYGTRSKTRAPRFGETNFPTDFFGSPFH